MKPFFSFQLQKVSSPHLIKINLTHLQMTEQYKLELQTEEMSRYEQDGQAGGQRNFLGYSPAIGVTGNHTSHSRCNSYESPASRLFRKEEIPHW